MVIRRVEAYAWYSVATLIDPGKYATPPSWVKSRDELVAKMGPAQLEKAQARAKVIAKELGLLPVSRKK